MRLRQIFFNIVFRDFWPRVTSNDPEITNFVTVSEGERYKIILCGRDRKSCVTVWMGGLVGTSLMGALGCCSLPTRSQIWGRSRAIETDPRLAPKPYWCDQSNKITQFHDNFKKNSPKISIFFLSSFLDDFLRLNEHFRSDLILLFEKRPMSFISFLFSISLYLRINVFFYLTFKFKWVSNFE